MRKILKAFTVNRNCFQAGKCWHKILIIGSHSRRKFKSLLQKSSYKSLSSLANWDLLLLQYPWNLYFARCTACQNRWSINQHTATNASQVIQESLIFLSQSLSPIYWMRSPQAVLQKFQTTPVLWVKLKLPCLLTREWIHLIIFLSMSKTETFKNLYNSCELLVGK